jgi:hypothetical protein
MINKNNKKTMLHSYAKNGFHLHPLKDRSKGARLKGWPEKCSTDTQVLDDWVGAYPDANWGIVTGGVSNTWMLDIDVKCGKNGFKSLADEFPNFDIEQFNTPIVQTPSGGVHIYFRYPEGKTIRNAANVFGLDGVNSVAWVEGDIDAWIDNQIRNSRGSPV